MSHRIDKFGQKLNYLFWWVRLLLFALTVIKIGSKTTKTSFQRLCLISACFKQNWSEVEIGLNLMFKERVYERKTATKMAEHVSLYFWKNLPYWLYYNPGILFFKMDFWVGFNSNLEKILPVFTKFWLKIRVLIGVVLKLVVGGVLFESGVQITSIRYIRLLNKFNENGDTMREQNWS